MRGGEREARRGAPLCSSSVRRDDHGIVDLLAHGLAEVLEHCWFGVELRDTGGEVSYGREESTLRPSEDGAHAAV